MSFFYSKFSGVGGKGAGGGGKEEDFKNRKFTIIGPKYEKYFNFKNDHKVVYNPLITSYEHFKFFKIYIFFNDIPNAGNQLVV